MTFTKVEYLVENKALLIYATGHPTDVIDAARRLASMILSGHGTWRFSSIYGEMPSEDVLDSGMDFKIIAENKL